MIAILIDAFVKSTVVLLLAVVVTLLLRRSPAALRHLVWALACGGVLALPLASALLPNVRLAGWRILVEDLALELGLARHVRLLQANGPAMPMTWGIRRPTILLPAEADDWSAERRRDVLLHELAHVKRHDFLIQLIARIACAV